MIDTDKKQFWSMINITMELCNKPPLSKEAILVWWNILEKYELQVVRDALDAWIDSETKPPSPSQIKDLCKPKEQFHKALPRPTISDEQLKKNLEKISDMVKPKDKTDYKKWARDILANPKGLPDISVRFAKEALNIN